jgi:hypothetical protein
MPESGFGHYAWKSYLARRRHAAKGVPLWDFFFKAKHLGLCMAHRGWV